MSKRAFAFLLFVWSVSAWTIGVLHAVSRIDFHATIVTTEAKAPVADMPQVGPGVGSDFPTDTGNRRVGARTRQAEYKVFNE